MTEYQCQDCEFTTSDEAVAEDHQKETDHCLTDVEVEEYGEEF